VVLCCVVLCCVVWCCVSVMSCGVWCDVRDVCDICDVHVWCVVCGSGVHVMLWCCEKYMSLDCNYETYSSEVF
jgi:hypothetical protein